MLKITEYETEDLTPALKLEGKLLKAWVSEVESLCVNRGDRRSPESLDLSCLTFVDLSGKKLLEELVSRGLVITACSGFVAELLHWEKS